MKVMLNGRLRDHNGQVVRYRLNRESYSPDLWVCSIDPHDRDEYSPAGSGRNHAEAITNALAWWKAYDAAP